MHTTFPIENFEKVILVDLTPSLCKIAEERFKRRGWDNVIVLCKDAATFETPFHTEGGVHLVTMSYSCKLVVKLLFAFFFSRWRGYGGKKRVVKKGA